MAFDSGLLKKVLEEISLAIDSHIDKIYQPSKDERASTAMLCSVAVPENE